MVVVPRNHSKAPPCSSRTSSDVMSHTDAIEDFQKSLLGTFF